ncbi:MAG TPA: aminotransferase class V-fold PLP-dependent enzyme [Longimicrobiales bacterium]|nr:aminotransferase class V-fold PLP-dependent enzyme [Longimicrobiales bacterium]
MSFDPQRWREDTPAVRHGRIHLNNAGAALMPGPVVAAVRAHLDREVQMGGYEAADAALGEIEACYRDVARLVGAEARNVAMVENATVAFAQALSAFDLGAGDVILTSLNDYISNQLMYLSLAQRRGVEVVRAAELPEGGVDPDSVRALLAARRPALVALTWVPTNSGLVQDVASIGTLCAERGTPYLVDACQAIGQITVDAPALHCDFLAATARKFLRGPRGAGFLFVSDRMLEQGRAPLLVDMRGARWTDADAWKLAPDATRFENWEFAYALVLGLGAAARYALDVGIAEAGAYAAGLAAHARARLAGLPGVRVLDRGARQCAIVTAEIAGVSADDIVARLREQAINTSATTRDSAVIDMDAKGVGSAVRISPHYYNTRREVEIAMGALEEFLPV